MSIPLPTQLAPLPTMLAGRGAAKAGFVVTIINNDIFHNGTKDAARDIQNEVK